MNYNNIFIFFIISLFFGVFSSCQQQSIGKKAATATIDSTYLQNVLAELGADKYMGRMPGTAAEPLTINYIKNEFEKIGLQPGNGDTYFQEVVFCVRILARGKKNSGIGLKILTNSILRNST